MILRVRRLPPLFRGFHAFACWPFIVVRRDVADLEGLLVHERVHYREQRASLLLPWLALYFLSRRFRLGAELRAYAAQVEAGAATVERAARALTRYRLGITEEQAADALRRALAHRRAR